MDYKQMTLQKMNQAIKENKRETKTAVFTCNIYPSLNDEFLKALKYYGYTKTEWLEYHMQNLIEMWEEDLESPI